MEAQSFFSALKGDSGVSREDLNRELEKAPYAAGLYLAVALVAHNRQDPDFETCLRRAAARTLSRSRLKELIEGPLRLEAEWQEVSSVAEEPETMASPGSQNNHPEAEEGKEQAGPLPENEPAEATGSVAEPENIVQEPTPSESIPRVQKVNGFTFGFVKVAGPKKGSPVSDPVVPYQLPEKPLTRKKKEKRPEDTLIDRFLEKSSGTISPRIDFGGKTEEQDLAKESGVLMEEIVTENMAMIYLKQKNLPKALATFQKLQLKFPEKSDYFAALIKNLENQINT